MNEAQPEAKAAEPAVDANKPQTPKGPHRWKPGESGNPNGRPKIIAEIRDLARANTTVAFNTLIAACTNEDAPWAARVAAASHILDRGYGKPSQSIVSTIRDARNLTDAELLRFLNEEAGGGGIAETAPDQGLPH